MSTFIHMRNESPQKSTVSTSTCSPASRENQSANEEQADHSEFDEKTGNQSRTKSGKSGSPVPPLATPEMSRSIQPSEDMHDEEVTDGPPPPPPPVPPAPLTRGPVPPKPPRSTERMLPGNLTHASWDLPSTSGMAASRGTTGSAWETDSEVYEDTSEEFQNHPALMWEVEELNMLRLRLLEEYMEGYADLPEGERILLEDLVIGLGPDELRFDPVFSDILHERKAADAVSAFNQGPEVNTECEVCLEQKKLYKRQCCQTPVCDDCLKQYLEATINEGIIQITCVGTECSTSMFRDEILTRVSLKVKEKYYRFLVDANKDPKVKTCPKCSHIHSLTDEEIEGKTKYGLLVGCPETTCGLKWCFICQAPWHEGIKCSEYRKGDKLVAKWAKEKHYGNANAQKCPKCKIFIERKGGCDHMVCSKCNQSFCYRCGGRYIDLKFFGNHLSRYSPIGCKYNFKPDQPVIRRAVRGTVLGAKILGGIFLVGIGIAAVGFLVGTSFIILPAFGGYKYYKRRKMKRMIKRQQELMKIRSKNAMMELHRDRIAERGHDPRVFGAMSYKGRVTSDPGTFSRSMPDLEVPTDSVHIGIQTGNSQQVDVTVHKPYRNPNEDHAPNTIEETVNSEIKMNICDEHGQVTVTTAEITNNPTSGDGSEAEVVLHVRTTYPKGEKEPPRGPKKDKNDDNAVKCESVSKTDHYETVVKSGDDSKLAGAEGQAWVKAGPSESSGVKSKSSVFHRRAHSTGSLKKPSKKQEFGSLSMKNKKSLQRELHDPLGNVYSVLPGPDLGHSGGLPDQTESRHLDDTDETNETEALSQSGCFMKLFGKKFQNQMEKDKIEKQGGIKNSDLIPGDCPDVVSCALEAELKRKDSCGTGDKDLDITKEYDPDRLMGLVAQESHTTSF